MTANRTNGDLDLRTETLHDMVVHVHNGYIKKIFGALRTQKAIPMFNLLNARIWQKSLGCNPGTTHPLPPPTLGTNTYRKSFLAAQGETPGALVKNAPRYTEVYKKQKKREKNLGHRPANNSHEDDIAHETR